MIKIFKIMNKYLSTTEMLNFNFILHLSYIYPSNIFISDFLTNFFCTPNISYQLLKQIRAGSLQVSISHCWSNNRESWIVFARAYKPLCTRARRLCHMKQMRATCHQMWMSHQIQIQNGPLVYIAELMSFYSRGRWSYYLK